MGQAEGRKSREIMNKLRLHGWFCYKVHGSALTMSGLPDIIVCAEGFFIGLETKMPEKRSNTSTNQKLVHAKIQAAGGSVFVVTSPTEAVRAVEKVLAQKS